MRVVTVTYADCVEGVLVYNSDEEAEHAAAIIKGSTEFPEGMHVQVLKPDALEDVLDYIRTP